MTKRPGKTVSVAAARDLDALAAAVPETTAAQDFTAQINAVLTRHAQARPAGTSGWSRYRQVQDRALHYMAPVDKRQARELVRALARLSKWVGCGTPADAVASALLSSCLSGSVQRVTWARRLIEAQPGAARTCSEDTILMRHMRAPEDPWLTDDWRWVVDKLMTQIIHPRHQEGVMVFEFNPTTNTNALLRAGYLARADQYAWKGKPEDWAALRWMSKSVDRHGLASEERKVIERLTAMGNHNHLERIARQSAKPTGVQTRKPPRM